MMSAVENPKISLQDLNDLEDRIKNNRATSEDYSVLDNYLSFLGVKNYILSTLEKHRINGYEEFIDQRKNYSSSEINMLVGSVLGVISTLKKYITGKL
ncbi:MAG: hypothetical protein V4557_06465 [Bacteroidota bacterium]